MMKFNELTFGQDEKRIPITSLENVSAMFAEPQWCIVADPRRTVEEGDASTTGTMFQSISMADFISRRSDGWSPFILDVRSLMEFQQGHVASCNHHVAHDSVVSSIDHLPTDTDIVLHCKSGMRSQIAAMLLIQAGMNGSKLYNLEGGILAWQSALPEEIVQ